MNWSDKAQRACAALIDQMRLPVDFEKTVREIYLPLAQIIIDKKQSQPLLININGAQGTGKSTLTAFLGRVIATEIEITVAELSIDDFYLTRKDRQMLAEQVHPLFITRGVPGTHDINMLEDALDALTSHRPFTVPRFDKSMDDRADHSLWTHYSEPLDVVIFEGWCVGSPAQSEDELASPINELEADEDTEGVWRHYANEQLENYHKRLFRNADLTIMLNAGDFERIYDWRRLQEQKLRATTTGLNTQHVMNDAELKRFIQHYERISRHSLKYLPDQADIVLPVAENHSITGIVQNGCCV